MRASFFFAMESLTLDELPNDMKYEITRHVHTVTDRALLRVAWRWYAVCPAASEPLVLQEDARYLQAARDDHVKALNYYRKGLPKGTFSVADVRIAAFVGEASQVLCAIARSWPRLPPLTPEQVNTIAYRVAITPGNEARVKSYWVSRSLHKNDTHYAWGAHMDNAPILLRALREQTQPSKWEGLLEDVAVQSPTAVCTHVFGTVAPSEWPEDALGKAAYHNIDNFLGLLQLQPDGIASLEAHDLQFMVADDSSAWERVIEPLVPPERWPLELFMSACAGGRVEQARTMLARRPDWHEDLLRTGGKKTGLRHDFHHLSLIKRMLTAVATLDTLQVPTTRYFRKHVAVKCFDEYRLEILDELYAQDAHWVNWGALILPRIAMHDFETSLAWLLRKEPGFRVTEEQLAAWRKFCQNDDYKGNAMHRQALAHERQRRRLWALLQPIVPSGTCGEFAVPTRELLEQPQSAEYPNWPATEEKKDGSLLQYDRPLYVHPRGFMYYCWNTGWDPPIRGISCSVCGDIHR